MSTEPDWGLFPEPQRVQLGLGDRVEVQTMWGREHGEVVRTGVDKDGWPFVELSMDHGDRIFLNVARVQRVESERA